MFSYVPEGKVFSDVPAGPTEGKVCFPMFLKVNCVYRCSWR